MKFFVKSIVRPYMKKAFSFLIYIFFGVILMLLYVFLENVISLNTLVVVLLLLATAELFVLQYFLKNILRSETIKINDEAKIKGLQSSVESADVVSNYRSTYFENLNNEVRTPLSTVFGMLKMLKKSNLDVDQKAQVEIAEYSSKYLLELINIVFENNNLKDEDLKLNLSAIDLKSDLSKLFETLEFQAWENNLDFEYSFLSKEKERFLVLGDAYKIQQVLINLVNNAIKYANSGKISIIVDQTVGIGDEQIITFYVKDTGVGLTSDQITSVLNIFNGTNTVSEKMNYCGRGLGLSISHKLVKLMGGVLKLESKEGEGATFYFSLSLKKTLNISASNENQKSNLTRRFNVLIAEDNRMSQRVIKYLLERQGVNCTFAKDGLEALNLYKILEFDLIFMDIYMPGMDGYVATEFIMKTNKYKTNKTPIIAVSASTFEKDREKAKSIGINDFLAKPIDDDLLKKLLLKHLKVESLNVSSCCYNN